MSHYSGTTGPQLFGASRETSVLEARPNGLWRDEVDHDMRLALAERLRAAYVREDHGQFVVRRTLMVYVATPEQFWELVNAEAKRIAMLLSRVTPTFSPRTAEVG